MNTALTVEGTNSNDGETFIVFELLGTHYALRSEEVRHLEMVETITPIPQAAAFVEGVVFSRGDVIPVLNLRARFGFEKISYTTRTRLLVVRHRDRSLGLIVDSAREFLRIPTATIRPPHENICDLSGRYLEGIATLKNRIVLILNLGEVVDVSDALAGAIKVTAGIVSPAPSTVLSEHQAQA